jgi:hypothetical protein
MDENDDVIEIPNGAHGIFVSNADNNTIGSELSAGDANRIAFNQGDGIAVFGSQHNAIHPNSIHSNAADGIRVADGANGGILPPIVTSLSPVSGTVPGTGTGVVYLFADAENEGESYLGSAIINGGTFSADLDLSAYEGLNLTAIQTREDQSSRFSAPLAISSDPFSQPLHVTTEGAGTVTSNPAGIDCGPTCDAEFDSGTAVELHAESAPGWEFTGWEGDCAGSGIDPFCVLTLDAPRSATAIFTADDRIFGNGFEPH